MSEDRINAEAGLPQSSANNGSFDQISRVFEVLDRKVKLNPLVKIKEALVSLKDESGSEINVRNESTVFGFDTNALVNIGNQAKSDDIIDFLKRQKNVVIPGQVIQETWNVINKRTQNQNLNNIKKMQKEDVESIRNLLGDDKSRHASELLQELRNLYEEYQPQTDTKYLNSLISTISSLEATAICPFVPRDSFLQLAEARNKTNTPPGFRDTDKNHGDYFVWADFLLGVYILDNPSIENIVLVTNDTKNDWSTKGVTHPILGAEVEALCKKRFQLWDLKHFSDYVKLNIDSNHLQ
ncbi:PIN-like domain-containing protein [Bifidobacterium psychraerophilum]|uniref:PIN like domain-containing protein n=1 Tax=Bifidobacterium psychraerophilum TaxID=218140 RepID=A0A087CI64_9BIFI|nr:PIN domain-containing protein [Bifidobacterium psychraerophilum]KFI82964.1 hypothetical protein BPSY_0755 [Bifidobacterium psychraerophilum]PKA94712.1 hypothetical protein A9A89_0937 [Bifidobacterium psychraerophilum DSM 22366]